MRALIVTAVIAVVCAVIWFARSSDAPIVTPAVVDPPTPAQPAAADPSAATREPVVVAEPAPTAAAPAPATAAAPAARDAEEPVLVAPFVLRCRVVHPDLQPIADAEVIVHDAKLSRGRPLPGGGSGNGYSGRKPGSEPIAKGRTAADGRCSIELDRECVCVSARADGFGPSFEHMVFHKPRSAELVIELAPPTFLRGVVLRADDTPAAGAEVRISTIMSTEHPGASAQPLEPTKAGPDGRFALPVAPRAHYTVRASLDGARAEPVEVRVDEGRDDEIVLRLPGANTIRGFVLDAAGQRVAGADIAIWEEFDLAAPRKNGAREAVQKTGTSDANGEFRIAVPYRVRYQAIASAKEHANSAPTWIEVSDAVPHADVTLKLERSESISGVVRREDGTPLAGIRVSLSAESGEDHSYSVLPNRSELFGRAAPVVTAADGGFSFAGVHPRTTWRLACTPDPTHRNVTVAKTGVHAGERDVEIVLTDAAVRGAVIRGTVVVAGSGAPVTAFTLQLVRYEGDKIRGLADLSATIEGNAFTTDPLTLGTRYGVVVHADGYALAWTGPMVVDRAEQEVVIAVPEFARATCRLLDASGAPVPNRGVAANAAESVPDSSFFGSLKTDENGIATFQRRAPGRYEIVAYDGGTKIASAQVEWRSGDNPQVELRLTR